jgi:hypothetical protein
MCISTHDDYVGLVNQPANPSPSQPPHAESMCLLLRAAATVAVRGGYPSDMLKRRLSWEYIDVGLQHDLNLSEIGDRMGLTPKRVKNLKEGADDGKMGIDDHVARLGDRDLMPLVHEFVARAYPKPISQQSICGKLAGLEHGKPAIKKALKRCCKHKWIKKTDEVSKEDKTQHYILPDKDSVINEPETLGALILKSERILQITQDAHPEKIYCETALLTTAGVAAVHQKLCPENAEQMKKKLKLYESVCSLEPPGAGPDLPWNFGAVAGCVQGEPGSRDPRGLVTSAALNYLHNLDPRRRTSQFFYTLAHFPKRARTAWLKPHHRLVSAHFDQILADAKKIDDSTPRKPFTLIFLFAFLRNLSPTH